MSMSLRPGISYTAQEQYEKGHSYDLMEPDYPLWYTGEDDGWNARTRTIKRWRLVAMKCNAKVGHWFEIPATSHHKLGQLEMPTPDQAKHIQSIFDGLEIRIKSDHVVVRATKTIAVLTNSEMPKTGWNRRSI